MDLFIRFLSIIPYIFSKRKGCGGLFTKNFWLFLQCRKPGPLCKTTSVSWLGLLSSALVFGCFAGQIVQFLINDSMIPTDGAIEISRGTGVAGQGPTIAAMHQT
jgi:hypothetical protein